MTLRASVHNKLTKDVHEISNTFHRKQGFPDDVQLSNSLYDR